MLKRCCFDSTPRCRGGVLKKYLLRHGDSVPSVQIAGSRPRCPSYF
jgi:hypothetical protein